MNRWMIYLRERFPLPANGALVAAFSASAVCFSSLVRGHAAIPSRSALLVAFLTSLLFFLQLRIADEFRDYEEDRQHRPYRPVPRGLVSLRELAVVAAASGVVQLTLALWLDRSLVRLLVIIWAYLALMTREFFVACWLRRHPIIYMMSHMVIVPLVDMYATACDWWVAGLSRPPDGLYWFLAVSFLNGVVIEIGRKTRAPEDEEPGVETYSALWGLGGALRAWATAILLTAALAWVAADRVGVGAPMAVLLVVLALACSSGAIWLVQSDRPGRGRVVEIMSGVWTIVMYLGLGAVPLMVAAWQA